MVGSTNIASASHHHHHHHQFHDHLMDGAAGDHQSSGVGVVHEDHPSFPGVTCSICLDSVADNAGRSIAKLQCGHRFHLDCIGSAFNIKGSMQCPNCRKVERGQWLYANGSTRSVPEISMDEWIPDEEFYDIGYPETPFRFHWCPFGELARIGSTFEEADSPSNTHHELRGHHPAYAEHVALSSVVHSYVALVGPVPPNSSRSSDSIDDPNFNHQWNGQSGHHEIFSAHPFPAINIPFHGWGRRSPLYTVTRGHINGVDPASVPLPFRSSNGETDARTRPAPFPHPVMFGLGSAPVAGSSFVSSIGPRHPGSSARVQISRAFHHRQQAGSLPGVPSPIIRGIRRYDGPRGLPALVPAPPQPDPSAGFLMVPPTAPAQTPQEPENPFPNHFHVWEREPLPWGSFGNRRPTGFWHRHSP